MSDFLLPEVLVEKAREVVDANRTAGRRLAVAESCTGGLVSAALTEISGSSDVFEAGYVTYSNAAKISELKVSEEVVDTFGAVSVATACLIPGSPAAAVAAIPQGRRKTLSVEHPSGETTCVLETDGDGAVVSAAMLRTARKLMDGKVFA